MTGNLRIESSDWDRDCEEAFKLALPPKWEFRDRSYGSAGWRPFPESVNTSINSIVRNGQRRGTINAQGTSLVVDVQDMVAAPTDQQYAVPRMLRKLMQQPSVNTSALRAFYLRYAEEMTPANHPSGPDGVSGQRFLDLFSDLNVDLASDVSALALACSCGAAEMGAFRRREFIQGCAALGVDTLDSLVAMMPTLRQEVLQGKRLQEVYAYTFGVALEAPSKVLPLEEAAQYWALLLPEWPLRDAFTTWAAAHMKCKVINRDLWMMVLKLALEVPADLSGYDDDPSWPHVFDEFVEYHRAQKGL